ncbi:2,3-bisphosphoglycerate-dependent phosphoglycerate mutase [Paenibacillus endophyticus]|uniref:2,3-bisphosphoglycerate-dependent phosphoglycerate mutase n=1 Tax=Paenibacillus endophyticus TaxID=1294268 RepID=A0A7W5GCA3_9BACL|nr:histidine phosphatase family protein [Paenibacillus endophyticus]MBB3154268.1 2,3-bisphosphoglycerate-dependent phosphoglycerate mutase [Paenibacillus endophyticus]
MTNLYFVRHAHSVYTPDELTRPLSEQGLNDAKKVTEFLKDLSVEYVISSPYKRAVQTVEGIAAYIGGQLFILEDFRERLLSGMPVDDFQAAIERVWDDTSFAWDGGESNAAAQKRGVEAMLQVLSSYPGKNVVIGTHGNLLVLIMNAFDQSYGFEFWKQLAMPDIYKLSFEGTKLMEVKRIWS